MFSIRNKRIIQCPFLTQQNFAKKMGVFFTVNRWESGRSKPNLKAMQSISAFYLENHISYEMIEKT